MGRVVFTTTVRCFQLKLEKLERSLQPSSRNGFSTAYIVFNWAVLLEMVSTGSYNFPSMEQAADWILPLILR